MSTISYRDTWTEISLDSIYHNATTFKNNLTNGARFMAVVKADGYGHGSVEVAKTALEAGADYLGVAFLDEALVLRKNGITTPILVLGYTPPTSVIKAIEEDITITVYSEDVLVECNKCAEDLNKKALIHLKVDTGMGRVGLTTKEDLLTLANIAVNANNIVLEGLFTHFASADSDDSTYTNEQFERFTEMIHYLEEHKIAIPIKHCCNSAGTINFPHMHLDMVRVGISLYGLRPSADVNNPAFPLQQAMHFKTKISALKKVSAGTSISYGCTFTATDATDIATIPVGYADGFSRLLSNKGHVLVHNTRVPIVGRVCMDQSMIDVSSLPAVTIGDEVTLFGGNDKSFLSIDEVAEHMGTINYEVVCLIGKRVPRVYKRNGQIKHVNNTILNS
ncbi:alanine racemase [Anaerobacillus sp. MEB173]|uniref:alanine racemase n=1 Tax=Anaerobacillus sp. MEB173 TaxID=3383345 RepID=UPI003F8E9F76